MEKSRFQHTVRHLLPAVAVVSMPVEAAAELHTGGVSAAVNTAAYRLIDFLTPEMALLGGLVLLAFVFIARRPGVR